MSETYIITAKTVDEAIAIANREYADADHEVAYDIIDMPKKGFFGIGARDAKIKITVSKVQKVELGSLVDDIRSMKTLTDRGGSRTQKQAKPAVNVTAQNSAKPAQNGQKSAQNAQTQKSAKPAQPKQNQPKTEKSAEKPVQKKPVENAQPKSDKLAQQKQQNQQKPAQKPAEKPQNQNQQKPKAEAKPAEKPVENKPVEAKQKPAQPKVETKVEPKVEPKSETKVEAKTEPVQTTEAKAEKTYTSHLGNEVKRTRRPERKPQHTENIAASGVTVSAPVGLSDFSGTKNGGFGSGEYKSGRISNDIKKKPALQGSATKPITDPAKANRDALKALTFDVDAHEKAKAEEAAPATAPVVTKAEKPQRPAKPARQNKPQQKPAEKAQPKEEKYPESALVKTEAAPAADASAEKRLREGVTQAEMDFALDFANTLLENMKLDAKAVQADANGDEYIINGEANVYPRINIIGADTGILIGHHGETLDAIQYLVNLSALRKSKQKDGDYVKIVVDIEGYREKREETLRTLARRMAARAVKYKRNVFLEPMNAYERRIIHSELQSFENVSTHSVGADKDRKIIITYEGPDKRERPDRRRAQASAVDANAVAAAEATDAVETDSVKNEERRRPKKPVKLPIDKLTDLLESREDNCTAPAISEDAADAVSETEEAKQLVETEAEVGAIPEYVGEEAEAEADEAVEAEEADETEEASEEETEKENDLADEEE